ncbi:hypothetical protein RHMOL_Rhmol06G0254500 [Rhododendron molle]|uniref:Uncharacterized protein n=1 Tax=Rhododendron molle TaxID=49168 RepID=A0ACC0NGV9_RHOML|nr:hypothetical protein RHMOL_Rhmol06G0254500 [Rhododendron molle]
MQLNLLELCKAEKVPWSGVLTNHSTSPFAEEMYEKIKEMLIEHEVVMNRWPQYSLIVENVEDILKSWASYLPVVGDKKSLFGEQMNAITVLLRTKYKNYMQATAVELVNNMQANRNTRLKRILEETKEADGEAEVRERMQMLSSQLIDSISNLHEVFSSHIFMGKVRIISLWFRLLANDLLEIY